MVIPKIDDSIRIPVNYKCRRLVSIFGKWLLPLTDEVLAYLGNNKVFSSSNLLPGFFYNAIDPASTELSAFVAAGGRYKRICMPQGHEAAPSAFAQLMPRAKNLGGLSYYRKFLPNLAKHLEPLTAMLKKGVAFDFTPVISGAARELVQELSQPIVLVIPDRDATRNQSHPLPPYCDVHQDGFDAVLEQQELDGSIRLITFISHTNTANG